jgi:predicted HTH transcriptional regulator
MTSIPVIPEDIASMRYAPFPEGQQVEYKESIWLPIWKVYQTLCAMLNEGGGHMVFGIRDYDLDIRGLFAQDKDIDRFVLSVDNIIHQGHIITITGNRLTTKNLTIKVMPLEGRPRKIVIVTVIPSLFTSYMLRNGSIYNRLNASNRFSTKLNLSKVDVQSQKTYQLIENVQSQYIKQIGRIQEEHQILITVYKNMITKLQEEKTATESQLVIYRRDRPISSWELFRRWVWSLFGYN